MAKLPKLDHVKYVRSKGKVYAYFNTGRKKAGRPIYTPLPSPASAAFYDSYAAMVGARTKRQAVSYMIAALAEEYQESTLFKAKPLGTRKYYSTTLRRITALLGKFPVNDLRRDDIQLVLDNDMVGPGAHNAFLALLGIIYTFARKRQKTDLEPVKDFDKLETGEHAAWPENVLEAGLQAPHDRTRLAIHLLYFTGQRIGDVMAMRWSDVKDGKVYVIQQKTGKKLQIPLAEELQAELDRTPKRGVTIITQQDGRPMTPQVVRRELKEFCDTMGHKLVPHGLRKNAVNSLLESGCTVAEASAITGQTYNIVEQYARQVDQGRLGSAAILKFENKRRTGKRSGKPLANPAEKRSVE
jgi:integrase